MYFRSRKKLQGEVSLNDSLDSDADGESLSLMDVVGVEDNDVFGHSGPRRLPARAKARARVPRPSERKRSSSRVTAGGRMPRTQREVAKKPASRGAMYRASKSAPQLEEALGERKNAGALAPPLMVLSEINRQNNIAPCYIITPPET